MSDPSTCLQYCSIYCYCYSLQFLWIVSRECFRWQISLTRKYQTRVKVTNALAYSTVVFTTVNSLQFLWIVSRECFRLQINLTRKYQTRVKVTNALAYSIVLFTTVNSLQFLWIVSRVCLIFVDIGLTHKYQTKVIVTNLLAYSTVVFIVTVIVYSFCGQCLENVLAGRSTLLANNRLG